MPEPTEANGRAHCFERANPTQNLSTEIRRVPLQGVGVNAGIWRLSSLREIWPENPPPPDKPIRGAVRTCFSSSAFQCGVQLLPKLGFLFKTWKLRSQQKRSR